MTSHSETNTDILIVGAGPTGLLLANLLSRMSVNFVIIDKKTTTILTTRGFH